ncbi:kinase-like domain-containing protein [Glomus cerebriforme]|uniref:Kinase-like domain-containing protein n=1 Tax=Glomus cerebriforme TaxID=658196 RepID=A0A397TEZ8_9GLOM|nr:kinase-like domain-containing protein [Glomus cerebriforme]
MADHHPENNGDTSLHEESAQYQNGNASVHAEINNDLVYRMPHYNEMYTHHVDSQYSTYMQNEFVDLSKHDRETVIEESPNQRYAKLNTVLGKGAYKVVYKAIDREEGYEVAWNCFQTTKAEFNDLSQEIKILKQVRHPNIINFHDCWYKDAEFIFVTELMTSGTLREYIRKLSLPNMKIVKRWSRQILKGLIYLHSHNPPIIHRDIKCDNIFINGAHGEVKIGDMGTAKMKLGKKYTVIGTPEFMAPEMYEEKGYNEKVDIYAFGMCLLEMVTGEYPYGECKNAAQIYKKVSQAIKPESLKKVQDPKILDLINNCLAPENERYTAQQIMDHPFLTVEPEVVLMTADETKTQLTLQVVFKGMDKLSVKFEFNVERDTAEEVVNEMIEEQVLQDNYQQLITHEINRILRDISKQTNEADPNKEEHKAPWPSQPGTPPFHVGMSPNLNPHKSSHGPSPTPINLERDSPNGTIASSYVQSQPIMPNESPRKNSISGPGSQEWSQDYEDALPVKEYPDETPIEQFVHDTALAINRDTEKANDWSKKLKSQDIMTVGDLRALMDEDWGQIGLTVFALRALKNALHVTKSKG